jgi:ribose 5-phosphate isomerase
VVGELIKGKGGVLVKWFFLRKISKEFYFLCQ